MAVAPNYTLDLYTSRPVVGGRDIQLRTVSANAPCADFDDREPHFNARSEH